MVRRTSCRSCVRAAIPKPVQRVPVMVWENLSYECSIESGRMQDRPVGMEMGKGAIDVCL